MNYLEALGGLKTSINNQVRHIAINTDTDDCEVMKDLIILLKDQMGLK